MRNFWRAILAVTILAAMPLTPRIARAQNGKHVPTIDESLSLKSVSSPMISPDGRYVAYRLSETNWKDNEFSNQLWLANLATGASFQLTRGKHAPGAAAWSRDGKWLAFVAERESSAIEPLAQEKKEEKTDETKDKKGDDKKDEGGGKPAAHQIWLISPEGGEAWQLTKSTTDVSDFEWSKDSNSIAFTASPEEAKSSKDRKEKYSDFEVYEKDYEQKQLWLVDVSAALKDFLPVAAKQLTADASLNVNQFAWSPDSTRIAFAATPNPMLAFSGDQDIYLLDLTKNNEVKKIVGLPGPDGAPMFSPDGKQLAFGTALGQPNFFYANRHIAVVDVDAVLAKTATSPADVRDLTSKFDEDPQPIDWGPDGIYFVALQRTSSHAFRLDPQSGGIQRITKPDSFFLGGVSFTRDFKTAAFTAADGTHLSELFVSAVSDFSPRKLTDMTAQVRDWMLGTSELVRWKSKDGAEIEGVLHKPAGYDASKKYPLLVMIHGGPTGVSLPTLLASSYAYPIPIFLSKGALVLEPNYRGSAGYGAAFRALNVRNLGVGDMWDVMSGVDSLIAKGIVDPNKLGSMGWSEGGYISAFLTTHTDRFKAISVGAGISDWMTYYVSTDITPFTRQYLGATPWSDPGIYAETSPITTIKQAKTPTLIQQGSNDKRVPVPDSYELYRGLQDENVASRLIFYTGFGHGVNKPKSRRALLQTNLDWFDHYIWGEDFPKNSPLFGSSEAAPAK
jgi:dipeptidyl aminopeptidase/acylaminoacyl peptidase